MPEPESYDDPVAAPGHLIGWIALWEAHWSAQAATLEDDTLMLNNGRERVLYARSAHLPPICEALAPRAEPEPEAEPAPQ